MRKIKITVAIPEVGEPSILYVGDDGDAAKAAFNAAKGTIDGEVLCIKNPVANHGRWKGKATAAPVRAARKTARRKVSV